MFCDWLKEKMIEKCYSQSDLSRLTGISDGAVSRHVRGKAKYPQRQILDKYAVLFGVPKEEVYAIASYEKQIYYVYRNLNKEQKKQLLVYGLSLMGEKNEY